MSKGKNPNKGTAPPKHPAEMNAREVKVMMDKQIEDLTRKNKWLYLQIENYQLNKEYNKIRNERVEIQTGAIENAQKKIQEAKDKIEKEAQGKEDKAVIKEEEKKPE